VGLLLSRPPLLPAPHLPRTLPPAEAGGYTMREAHPDYQYRYDAVLRTLRERGPSSPREIADETGFTKQQVYQALQSLFIARRVERRDDHPGARRWRWRLAA